MIRAWNRFWFTPAPPLPLGICRALFFSMLLLWQLGRDYAAWGSYSRVFWMPISLFDALHLRPLSVPMLDLTQIVWKTSLAFCAVGLWSRPAMIVAFALGTYLMGLPHNFGQIQHFDTLAVFTCGMLAVSRAGDAFSLDALLARRRGVVAPVAHWEYRWPIRFVWVAMSIIFCAAGLSKLRHSGLDWILSDNLAALLLRQQYHLSDGEPLTNWGIWVASHRWLARGMAAASVSVETLFPLVLFSRRARLVLVPAGLAFLIGIRVLMGPTFEQFMMCYVFWVPWERLLGYQRVSGVSRVAVNPEDDPFAFATPTPPAPAAR
jgi:hypothetical protein